MLNNLANLLGDLDFLGGVAKGFGEESLRQEDRKDKDYRELRKFGMERGLQISEDNRNALDVAEDQVKELAFLVAGDRKANSPEALEAAFYLIEANGGVAGATDIAKKYYQQYDKFGIDPINEMGLEERTDGVTLTPRAIGSTFTKLKPLPDLSQSPIGTRKTALDVIFNRKPVEDIVGEEMETMFGASDQTAAALSPVRADPTDQRFIIGSNYNEELGTLTALQKEHHKVPEKNQDEDWKTINNVLRGRITLLLTATKPEMGETQRRQAKGSLLATIMAAYGLKADFDNNMIYRDAGTDQSLYRKSDIAASRMTTLMLEAVNMRYVGIGPDGEVYDPREFVEVFGAAQGKNIVKVIPEDGSDPYLSVGDSIFSPKDMSTKQWQNSTVLGGGVQPPPPVGAPVSGAASASGQSKTGSLIPNSLMNSLTGNMPGQQGAVASKRKASANAIMTIIRRNNPGKSQPDLDAIFKSSTGIDWSTASK